MSLPTSHSEHGYDLYFFNSVSPSNFNPFRFNFAYFFNMSTAVFRVTSNNIGTGTWAETTDPSNNVLLQSFKAAFNSVLVTKVVVTANLTQIDDYVVRFGLFRSLAGTPVNHAAIMQVPFLHEVSCDSRTAKSHTVVFHPANSPIGDENRLTVGVPGLEWDLKQTAIRSGHPHTIICVDRSMIATPPTQPAVVGSLSVEYHVQLSEAGPGY